MDYLSNIAGIHDIYNPLPPIPVLHAELKDQLRARMKSTLVHLVRKNMETTFFRESDSLTDLRRSILPSGKGQTIDHDERVLEQFTAHVPLSTYEVYRPFVERFFPSASNENSPSPCSIGTVKDLFSPGLPMFLARTGGTSGSKYKFLPKYAHPALVNDGVVHSIEGLTMCGMFGLQPPWDKVLVTDTEDAKETKHIPITNLITGYMRVFYAINSENEEEMAKVKVPRHVAPLAVGMLPSFNAMSFTQLFFAVSDKKLGYLAAAFTTGLSDAIYNLINHWNLVIDCIEEGTLPEPFPVGKHKAYLQTQVKPNPTRAGELRAVVVGAQGWLNKVWPYLKVVRTITSGAQFSALVPKLRDQFGPDVAIITRGYVSTECFIGAAYSAFDINLYKLHSFDFFEFLGVDKPATSEHLLPCWEVKTGNQYEIVATTQDGLWRYGMGDIIEVAGFAPEDGMPLMRYIERRGVTFRVGYEFVTETELVEAIRSESMEKVLGDIDEFVNFLDARKPLNAYGFFVELRNYEGKARPPSTATTTLQANLSTTNATYGKYTDLGEIGPPTIHIVSPGTFRAYREWKMNQRGTPAALVKVPVSVSPDDTASVEFFWERVLYEV